ncbi:nitroreductase family protein [Pontiella sp.]|uniref:nitroreductase family protein n=1 Tax=Pontiella sp. TaxID=2837462 RepID=UPI003565EE8F
MNLIDIDSEICTACGLCIVECPFGLLAQQTGDVPDLIPGGESFCMRCGHCLAVCPVGALALDGETPESCDPAQTGAVVDPPAMAALLKNRRSIREYKDRPVPRKDMQELMEPVRWAPTAKNEQPVHWLLVDDRAAIHDLARLTVEWAREIDRMPELVTAWDAGKDLVLRNAPLLAIATAPSDGLSPVIDSTIAASALELAATAYGLGSCWAGYFMRAAQQYGPIAERLNLPRGHQVCAALMMGYPKRTYHRVPPRKPADVTWLGSV